MHLVFIDFETRSELNINKRKKTISVSSVYDYARHPSTEVLCVAFAIDDRPVVAWASRHSNGIEKGLFEGSTSIGDPAEKLKPLFDAIPDALVIAHNSFFERCVWEGLCIPRLGWPAIQPEQWRCTSALSRLFCGPSSLKDAADFYGLPGKLDTDTMLKLCSPNPKWLSGKKNAPKWLGTPADFEALQEYCKQDVETTRALWKVLPKQTPYELDVWKADQEVNMRGVHVNLALAEACQREHDKVVADSKAELAEITEGKVGSPDERDKILAWLKGQGAKLDNLQADTVSQALMRFIPPAARRVLEIRQEAGSAAAKKYAAIISQASPDSRLRGLYKYCGATRTGRWTSEGPQAQNLIKPDKSQDVESIELYMPDVVAGRWGDVRIFAPSKRIAIDACLRPTFCAAPGKVLVALDYAAIEARLTAWYARETQMLEAFASGRSLYMEMAKDIDMRDPNRELGKVTILGLGFGMGFNTFLNTCHSWGIKASLYTIQHAIDIYRSKYLKIVQLWNDVEHRIRLAIRNPGQLVSLRNLEFAYSKEKSILVIRLASGRKLFYHNIKVADKKITYAELKRSADGDWPTTYTWGGTFVENIVQATAADIQRYAIWSCARYMPQAPVVMHSHDEVVTEADADKAETTYNIQRALMLSLPNWCDDLPMDAKGWTGPFYRKD